MIPLKTFTNKTTISPPMRAAAALTLGCAAGFVNGFLGTGGGIVLMAAMGLLPEDIDARDKFAAVIASIYPMSLLSAANYGLRESFNAAAPYLLSGILGGVTGALLLDHASPKMLRKLFAAMTIWAGVNFLR